MNEGTDLFGTTTVLFFKLANQKEALSISSALIKKGAKVQLFFDQKELKRFLWEVTLETKVYGVIFDEDIINSESIKKMFGGEILTSAMSFPENYPPVVVSDVNPLDLFLRNLFCKQEVLKN